MRDTTNYLYLVTPWYQLRAWQTIPDSIPSLETLRERMLQWQISEKWIKETSSSVWKSGGIPHLMRAQIIDIPRPDDDHIIQFMLDQHRHPFVIPMSVPFAMKYFDHIEHFSNKNNWKSIAEEIARFKSERFLFGL